MKHKTKQKIGLTLFFSFAGLLVSFASTLELSRSHIPEETQFQEWKNAATPKELLSKDQWYDLSRSRTFHN